MRGDGYVAGGRIRYGWIRYWNGWALQRIVFAVGGRWERWYLEGSLCWYSLWAMVVHSGT